MNLERYLANKQSRLKDQTQRRELCMSCLQPKRTCFCKVVHTFDPNIEFVILIHPIEVRRRIATGRMSHLCLETSKLLMGYDYSDNTQLNKILDNPNNHCVILYPGKNSTNLTDMSLSEKRLLVPEGRNLVVVTIDGTWHTARKMLLKSRNLHHLPRICFVPPKPSTFRVRQQPKPECYSTIEAIHHTIELLGDSVGFDVAAREHDCLLKVFDYMVEQQLEFIRKTSTWRTRSRHSRLRL